MILKQGIVKLKKWKGNFFKCRNIFGTYKVESQNFLDPVLTKP